MKYKTKETKILEEVDREDLSLWKTTIFRQSLRILAKGLKDLGAVKNKGCIHFSFPKIKMISSILVYTYI